MFTNSKNFQISGGNFVVRSNIVQSGNVLSYTFSSVVAQSRTYPTGIDRLYQYCTADATHDSYARRSKTCCIEGTRTQYIQAVTGWASSLGSQHRLLWLWGPAGVGKTAIAQSCAKETAARGALGATFFFSRDNGVVNPTHFFTTIAYQLAAQLNDYKAVLGGKIQRNPSILMKGLDSQFKELIIAPFLELEEQNVHAQQRTVFVDGLDECSDELAQSEMVKLIADSVAQYGKKVPLLWAFFSRPERFIDSTFSKYSTRPFCWLIKLPVSHDDDPDIRLYFRACLRVALGNALDPSSNQGLWPSENDLTALVLMVKGLFIYAAVIVKFIMDPDSLSPQRQLQDVLSLRSDRMRSVQSSNQDGPLAELDCFYCMIMARIPTKLLPFTQQILLIHTRWILPFDTYLARVHTSPPVRLLANLLGLTLQELENCLSKLRSVLTFQQMDDYTSEYRHRERDEWPGSSMIVFYHASFMEFLCDKKRSGQYCVEDQCHWAALAVRGLRLLKDIYALNGMSRYEKIRELHKLLPVFLGDAFSAIEALDFRDELCHDFLLNYIPTWCQSSGFADEVVQELHKTDLLMLVRLGEGLDDSVGWRQLPQDLCLVDPRWKVRHRRPPRDLLREHGLREPSARPESILAYISSALKILTDPTGSFEDADQTTDANHSLIQERCSSIRLKVAEYFSSYVRDVLKLAMKLKLETLDEFDLLEYYSHEWCQFRLHFFSILSWRAPESIKKVAFLPWEMHFFPVLQGTDDRLTKAAFMRLKKLRDRDLLDRDAKDALKDFFDSTTKMRPTADFSSTSYYAEHVNIEVLCATEDHYTAERSHLFSPDGTPLFNFKRVAARLDEERYLHLPGEYRNDMMQSCTDTLLKGYREDLYREFTVHLVAGDDENLSWILRASAWSLTITDQLLVIFRAHLSKTVFDAILGTNEDDIAPLKDPDSFVHDVLDILQQNLGLIEESIEINGAHQVPDGCAKMFRDSVNQVLEDILNSYPQYRSQALKLHAERARKAKERRKRNLARGESYRFLYESDIESYSEESCDEEPDYKEPSYSDRKGAGWEEPSSPTHSNEITSYVANFGMPRLPHRCQPSGNSRSPTPHTNGGSIEETQLPGLVGAPEKSTLPQNPAEAEAGMWVLVGEVIDYFLRPWGHGVDS